MYLNKITSGSGILKVESKNTIWDLTCKTESCRWYYLWWIISKVNTLIYLRKFHSPLKVNTGYQNELNEKSLFYDYSGLFFQISHYSPCIKWWSYRCYKLKNQVNFFTYISLSWAELIALNYIYDCQAKGSTNLRNQFSLAQFWMFVDFSSWVNTTK